MKNAGLAMILSLTVMAGYTIAVINPFATAPDPSADIITHAERAISSFISKDYDLFFEASKDLDSASSELIKARFSGPPAIYSESASCESSVFHAQARLVQDLLTPLALLYSNGEVRKNSLEANVMYLDDTLQSSRKSGTFSLSSERERQFQEGCDEFYPGYSAAQRVFDLYVFENINKWVANFGEAAGLDVEEEAESIRQQRSFMNRLDSPNAWPLLSDAEQSHFYGTNTEVRDCISAATKDKLPSSISTREISALCKAGLSR